MRCRTCGTRLLPGALLCGECGTSAFAPRPTLGETAHHDRRALLAAITADRPAAPPPPTRAARAAHAAVPLRDEARRLVLDFSTGESIRVAGTGLIGRNPTPAESEHLDYLVQLVDPARSVSKTHLEFAVEAGELWIRDRGSTNGSRAGRTELTPGEWHRVVRGDRVLLGDQWFDVH